jgi:hypothetical protein
MRIPYLFLLLLATSTVFSQEDAWVYFNAKPNTQTYFAAPLQMLSQRALDRRARQNIALDSKDVPIPTVYINQIKSATGITVMAQSKWLNALHIRGTAAAITALKNLAMVEKVVFANRSLNPTAKITTIAKPKNGVNKLETQIDFAYGSSANQIQMLNGHLLHQQNYTASDKIIAIMDAGFPGVNTAQPFQRLRDQNKILGGYDFVHRSTNFYSGNHHGTMVLSSMGGYKDNALVGTAPDASYYLFITEDTASENPIEESLWVEAAEKADSLGVDVINTSLGYFGYDNPNYSHRYSDMTGDNNYISKAANVAFSRGMIVVASAGNEGGTSEPHVGAPAEATDVIAVGAVTATKALASFSSIGPSYDGRVKPNVMAQGQASVLSDEYGNIVTANGTSFSGPIMAGMIASFWQAFPNKTNQEIRQLVQASADRYASPNNQFGYGIPNFSLALANGKLITDDFVVYPNPSSDLIHFNLPESNMKGTLVVFSILGQKMVEQFSANRFLTLSVANLPIGIYFYTFESEGFSKTGKIIKK